MRVLRMYDGDVTLTRINLESVEPTGLQAVGNSKRATSALQPQTHTRPLIPPWRNSDLTVNCAMAVRYGDHLVGLVYRNALLTYN